MVGLEYATKGTMTVNGHKLVVVEKDTQGKPDVAKSILEAAYADDKAALAMGPPQGARARPVTSPDTWLGPPATTRCGDHPRLWDNPSEPQGHRRCA